MLVDVEAPPVIQAVDLTIDGLHVIADTLNAYDFPLVLGVGADNIFDTVLRERVWADVREKFHEQNILNERGAVHPGLAEILWTITRRERTLEARWWRKQSETLLRFAICRRGTEHVIAARSDDRIVLQRINPQIGLAGMVEAVIGTVAPADMGPVTGPTDQIEKATDTGHLTRYGCDPHSATTLLLAIQQQVEWVHVVATETLPGGSVDRPTPAVGILDSQVGRIVASPSTADRTTFMAGSRHNLTRALTELYAFLPSGTWDDE